MLVCEVLVIGLGVNAWVKRMPSFASAVECRRLNSFVAVAVDVVGAKGVDGDQKNVRPGGIFPCLVPPQERHRLSRKMTRIRAAFTHFRLA